MTITYPDGSKSVLDETIFDTLDDVDMEFVAYKPSNHKVDGKSYYMELTAAVASIDGRKWGFSQFVDLSDELTFTDEDFAAVTDFATNCGTNGTCEDPAAISSVLGGFDSLIRWGDRVPAMENFINKCGADLEACQNLESVTEMLGAMQLDYYMYEGSSVDEDCESGWTWVVFKDPILLPSGVIQTLESFGVSIDDLISDMKEANTETQPLNDRTVSSGGTNYVVKDTETGKTVDSKVEAEAYKERQEALKEGGVLGMASFTSAVVAAIAVSAF